MWRNIGQLAPGLPFIMVAWRGKTVSIARAEKNSGNIGRKKEAGSYPLSPFKSVDQINFSNFTDLEGSCTGSRSGQVHPATGEPCTPLHPNATAEVEREASLDCAQSSLCSQRHWERWCVQLSEGMAESAQWKDPLASKVCRCFKMFTECGEYMYITNHYVFVW